MTTAVGSCIEVAEFRWGPSDLGATTDVTWIKAAFSRAGAIRLIGYDMGPQTQKFTGHYDYGHWIDIPAADVPLFVTCILNKLLDGDGPGDLEQLKDSCTDWGVSFTEGDGPYSPEIEDIQ